MKTIPKAVTLGGHKIAIKHVGGLVANQSNGRANWDSKTMELRPGMTGTELGEVFLHECIHMVSECYDLGLSERDVRVLGVGLQQMLSFKPK